MEERFEQFLIKVGRAREARGLSAYELSLRLGKDGSYFNKLENGHVNVKLKTIYQICEILGIDPKDIV